MTERLLFKAAEWDFDTLKRIDDACSEIAIGELGLNVYPNQIEVITSEQMLDAYSSIGMPIFYKHWSFGKQFAHQEGMYRKGYMGLAYEIVINSSPCISYLMEENTATMQTLVIAHAAYGHNHFFKNNYLFKEWTDAEGIIDYLEFAKNYVAKCEERFGPQAVELTLDAAHALMSHAVHRYRGKKKISFKDEKERTKRRREDAEANFNDLWRTLPVAKTKDERDRVVDQRRERLGLPEENLLYFLEKYAPRLQPWQREILRIVRKVAQYFYPQGQTKVMNEGTATYVHYRIMKRLHEKGQISDGNWLEFIQSHTNVTYQPDFDSEHFSGWNPYALGFAMMQDIEGIVTGLDLDNLDPSTGLPLPRTEEQLAEDREWFPDIAGKGDAMAVLRDTWANYRDESFIRQFLSPRVMRKMRMFHLLDNPSNEEGVEVRRIHNESGFRDVRIALAEHFDIGNRPNIEIVDVNLEGERVLELEHMVRNGRMIDGNDADKVLKHLANLWTYRVSLAEQSDG
jgi:stage V sporulation protein R